MVTAKAGCGLTGNQAGISPLDEVFFIYNLPGGFVPDCGTRHEGNTAKQQVHMRKLNCHTGDLAITVYQKIDHSAGFIGGATADGDDDS